MSVILNKELAPICLFTYNRLEETMRTIEALKNNYLARDSQLFIFSDGAKNEKSIVKVLNVRTFLRTITGFKSVKIFESEGNMGLAKSIINGVTQIINEFGKVIVLEDDLITTSNYLDFMNKALVFYEKSQKVFSISGYSMDLPSLIKYPKDYYFGYRASSWGWGTWENRWGLVDWESFGYKKTVWSPSKHLKFMRGGSDMPFMLWKQMNGKIDSWAIRWCYHQFKNDLLTLFPTVSKLESIGFGEDATHTSGATRFNTVMDSEFKTNFEFEVDINLDENLVSEFRDKFSILSRIKGKLI